MGGEDWPGPAQAGHYVRKSGSSRTLTYLHGVKWRPHPMNPERCQRIEALYHAALARPADERAAFLAEACGSDEALKQEVASFAEQASGHELFAAPETALAADLAVAGGSTIAAPRLPPMLDSYRIDRLLGRGGMGEVYRAHDTRLRRDVAIKILPGAFVSDPDRATSGPTARVAATT